MRALIIGSGIGGLTSAIALRQAGVDAVVFERAEDVRKIQLGGGIHAWNNGMRGFKRVGLDERVRALGGPDAEVKRLEFRTAGGSLLAAWPMTKLEEETGVPIVGVVRSELHGVLTDALGEEALQLGATFTGFTDQGEGVVARFADGREERGDVLIGADGLRSTVRAQLHGDEEPAYVGYVSWQAYTHFQDERAPVGMFRVTGGRGGRFIFYHLGHGRVYWELLFLTPRGASDPAGPKETILRHVRGWREPIEAIVEATDESAITRMEMFDRKPLKTWGTGRVTLLGDAAHAMTNSMGQGANQTIEDAIVLAECLPGASPPESGLREYERRRMKRTKKVVSMSGLLGRLVLWRNPAATWLRDNIFRIAYRTGAFRQTRKDMAREF